MVHGFTQNAECWGRFAERMSDYFELVLVDAPGHGASGHDEADLWEAGRLIGEVGGEAHYLGYSMGGRMLLHAAIQNPALVRSLSLIGATAGIEHSAERGERRAADEALADRLLSEGLPTFLDRWLALPLFAGLAPADNALDKRLTNRPEGLAASLRYCGTGTQDSLWNRLDEIPTPTLVLAGTQDQKFTALGQRLATALPQGEFASAVGGHPIHSEQPDQVTEIVSAFVRRVES